MADFALAHMKDLPVSIASLGLLYDKSDGLIGQVRKNKKNEASLNLIDLSLLPLTPIMVRCGCYQHCLCLYNFIAIPPQLTCFKSFFILFYFIVFFNVFFSASFILLRAV